QQNGVYVLNDDMETVGVLDDLAPGETIYSARFMGERAYLVTFKQVDPLFVIDLSDPTDPTVLGKLKIPGYSNYLHPLDETHLIGIGKDAVVSKDEIAYTLGMKLSLFDVSDVENPIELHSVSIGARGTDSYALQDPKAFLFDAEKELMVLPIYLYEENPVEDPYQGDWPAYGIPSYQGAFVYHVSVEDGFVERGKITHISKEVDLKSGYYYDYDYQVKRSLFIDNVLYTISNKIIKAHDLDSLDEVAVVPLVNIPKGLTVKSRVEGVFCVDTCGYTEVVITEKKISTKSYSGGKDGFLNSSEYAAGTQYEDLVESLDLDAFFALEETLGCPGCADGSIETITVSDGKKSHTVRMEAGMEVEGFANFLNTLRGYGGGYYYYDTPLVKGIGVSEGAATPPSAGTAEVDTDGS
ncbi:MAG: beta-propeller domain-containing protein, partial [archaeon]